MTARERTAKGGIVLSTGHVAGQSLGFVRNIIVARLISVEDFGIAATFVVTVSVLEMISDLGWDKLLIQAEDGDDPRLQATAQAMQFVRGVANSAVLFALAWPVSSMFGVPEARWAFQWLAVIPVLRGLSHLDRKRCQRKMKYGPDVLVELGSQAVMVVLAWPFAWWIGGYAAMLWLLVLQFGVLTAGSHLAANRPYRWAWDRQHVRRMTTFGWPLALNGVLMFLILQGDRFVVGMAYGMVSLGIYSVAFALTMTPTVILARTTQSLLLPLLSRAQGDPTRLAQRYAKSMQAIAVIAALVAIGFIGLGAHLVPMLYGAKYAAAGDVLGWLAAMQALRLYRAGPTLAAMAKGDTRNSMNANLVRTVGFVGALFAATAGVNIVWIAIAGTVGEALSLLYSTARLRRVHGMMVSPTLVPAAVMLVALAVAGLLTTRMAGTGLVVASVATTAPMGGLILAALFAFPGLRGEVFVSARGVINHLKMGLVTRRTQEQCST